MRDTAWGNCIMGLIWFAVRVPAQKEFLAERILREQGGLNVYLPIEHKWKRYNRIDRRRRQVARPLLVRYLFVGFAELPIPWHELFCFEVVRSVVGSAGVPRQISEPVMEHVRSLSASPLPSEPYALPVRKPPDIGAEVKIISGPFTDSTIRVREITDRKIRGLLNEKWEAEVGLEQLEAAQ